MPRLTGKVAIVTGSSRGIGEAIARRLARDGAKVVVNFTKNGEAAERVASEIRYAGGNAFTCQADLSDPDQIPQLFDLTREAYGRLDILVNNAAVAELNTPIEQIDLGHFHRQFDVNVRGLLLATKYAVAAIGGDGGRIINLSSGITRTPAPGSTVYAATKAAVELFTRALARELGPRGITVNAVSPGLTVTDMFKSAMDPAVADSLVAMTPLGRLGTPDDIADVVAFLASDDARWVTGEILGATGGL
jgi:3-oxoacyl-[acyl-carrier protein] reductase